jgi:NAD(P)-dependent dehydrogenase (short-subunit alcohol dehydrogenase family)
VVTGAGGGLGRAYAVALAEHGANLVINDVRGDRLYETEGLIRDQGCRVVSHVGSVSEWTSAHALIDLCVSEYGRIDGLVNNAGVLYERSPWDEDEDAIRRITESNLIGTMFCGVHALRHMVEAGYGSIVNVSSGAQTGMLGVASYGATKGAVTALTYGWALEAAAHAVRVNAVMPVATTAMTRKKDGPRKDPRAVAPLVVYLISNRSAGITGRILRHDGGAISMLPSPSLGTPHRIDDCKSVEEIEFLIGRMLQTR